MLTMPSLRWWMPEEAFEVNFILFLGLIIDITSALITTGGGFYLTYILSPIHRVALGGN